MTDRNAIVALDDASIEHTIGQCVECCRLAQGPALSGDQCCKNCKGEIMPLIDCKVRGRLEIDYLTFGVCTGCARYGPLYNECSACEDEGFIYRKLTEDDEKKIIAAKCQPLCGHDECREKCMKLLPRFPPQLILAGSMVQAVRAFEAMLENGLDESFQVSKAIIRTPYESSFLEDELFSMYLHHPKLCICIVCKFCTVVEIDQLLRSKLCSANESDEIDEDDEDEADEPE